jgi:hypothetical protein
MKGKKMHKQLGGEDMSMNTIQQMKYGAEKMMSKATMSGMLNKAMGGKEMPKRGQRFKTHKKSKK